jgi:hypothetical protein
MSAVSETRSQRDKEIRRKTEKVVAAEFRQNFVFDLSSFYNLSTFKDADMKGGRLECA